MSKKDPRVWEPITPDFLLSSPFLSSSPHPFSSRVLNCGPSLILICCFDMQIMALIIHAWDLLLPPRDGWEIVCEVKMMVGVTPRPKRVYGTGNRRGAYVHQRLS